MKIEFLGTAAAEGVPALFCQCDVCKRARAAGGKNIRSRSQALIDDKLLVEFPPDTYWHFIRSNIDMAHIEDCLVTHLHSDHLYPDDLSFRRDGYSHLYDAPKFINIHASAPVLDLIRSSKQSDLHGDENSSGVSLYVHVPFESFWAGEFLVTALPANHGTESPFIYIIRRRGKAFLYAHDTGLFLDNVWEWLEDSDIRFDAVSLDCTSGIKHLNSGKHMTFEHCIEVRNRLTAIGCADKNTKFFLNHFSHNGQATYDELVPVAEKENFIVSYDGLVAEF